VYSGGALITVYIRDMWGQTVRTLVDGAPREAGTYPDVWDGRDDQGMVLPDGAYYFVVDAELAGGAVLTYDLTATTGGSQHYPGKSFPTTFSPFDDQLCPINYNVSYKSEITVWIGPFTGGERFRTLLEHEPQASGPHQVVWDGTDDQGSYMAGVYSSGYLVGIIGWRLPDNAVVCRGARPVVSNVTVTPNYYDPSYHSEEPVGYRNAIVEFDLSETANVSVTVYNEDNAIVRIITQAGLPAGPNSLAWDGRNGEGQLVADGRYRLGVRAVDSEGFASMVAYGFVKVFY